ncbi:MAG: tRNA uridine-5-carboxymethylaminomethyl(34) synthesis GTPase MnmE [Flavobacteriales bacterium]|nr:MAG: tRNA modification gtpase trme [Chlorobi bacterium OLB6]MBE2265932.1 tRNA uridine-5-carboxymethylaminomethyl(34) synthesis GTPase MnmE [Flavobacteriales bacterium]MBV6464142.1 tRNA modification GTPase MnmE [Chlorobiota bacterium]MBW7852868.1 tRNA uridine-5-carboxymethylaminomethyl(34) synthesis GTPase MnmE [Candidatus Kapabacteria bacterium]MCC6330901.1 tRNA uridine-5-carboxymethylaminomethyl(34) synthesis GTPase MnmE [Ignavibacteria bacterium]
MNNTISHRETICALATPPGIAGLAVIRVSGNEALSVCDQLFSGNQTIERAATHTILVGWFKTEDSLIDEVTMSVFKSPHSYTGEDVVEIGCHGGHFVVNRILTALIAAGIRAALPGEFTRRAFLNRKIDLTHAEAIADLIHAQSSAGAETAARQLAGGYTVKLRNLENELIKIAGLLEVELDFSEEGYEFVNRPEFLESLHTGIDYATQLRGTAHWAQIARSGLLCAVVGYPNAGKSSMFNALLERNRAIVSSVPGTTRDYLEESLIVDGYTIRLIDTAGLRITSNEIEKAGIESAYSLLNQCNVIVVVNDVSKGTENSNPLLAELRELHPEKDFVLVQNKTDLVPNEVISPPPVQAHNVYYTNATTITSDGMKVLLSLLVDIAKSTSGAHLDALVNSRQAQLLTVLISQLQSAKDALERSEPSDIIAVDIRQAIQTLSSLTGKTWNPDVLDAVFSNFCIGK